MQLDFVLLADGVTERPDGKLDIYGAGFDTVIAATVPAQHPRLVLAMRILVSRQEAEHAHRLDVILQHADGAELARVSGEIPVLSEDQRERIVPGRRGGLGLQLIFQDTVFPDFGAYQFVIQWDGNEMRSPLPLFVAELPPPE